jgi:hypothetical protein
MAVAATALHLGYGVLVGPTDEIHSRPGPHLRVEVLRACHLCSTRSTYRLRGTMTIVGSSGNRPNLLP